ncbi:MAG: hypothetical protein KKD44_14015 [Proteobacteria bacterium]|nr:hypothetical protein [Pseudomonadota bacterium]
MDRQLSERMGKLPPYLFGTLNTMKIERRRLGHDIIENKHRLRQALRQISRM